MVLSRRRLAIAIASALAFCVVASGAAAAPSEMGEHPNTVQQAAADDDWSGPPHLLRIDDAESAYGMRFNNVEQTVRKQKLHIRLPKISTMQYTQVCYFFPTLGPSGMIRSTTERPVPVFHPYLPPDSRPPEWPPVCTKSGEVMDKVSEIPASMWRGSTAFDKSWILINASAWVLSPEGAPRAFGVFPAVQVRSLAFGSIPVTATLHLSQPMEGGLTQPFTLMWSGSGGLFGPGTDLPGFGQGPNSTGEAGFFQTKTHFTGPVTIRLSDVRADGVPLKVGPKCAARGRVQFQPKAGWVIQRDHAVKGEPGEFAPLNAPGYLPGTVDIGSFSGCGQGGDDLDSLFTNMISGPDNVIEMEIDVALNPWCYGEPSSPSYVGGVYCDLDSTPTGVGRTRADTAPLRKHLLEMSQRDGSLTSAPPQADLSRLSPKDRKQAAAVMRKLTKDPLYGLHR